MLFLTALESAELDPMDRSFRYHVNWGDIQIYSPNMSPYQQAEARFVHSPFVVFHRNGRSVWSVPYQDLAYLEQSTPLIKWLMPSLSALLITGDEVEVSRRALPQILALRSWQLTHDGKFPERLELLVPSELDQLPNDPFAKQPFRYILSVGQYVFPLGTDQLWENERVQAEPPSVPSEGLWFLYSVGPNDQDDNGRSSSNSVSMDLDIAFPLPREAWRPKPKVFDGAAAGGMGAAMMGGGAAGAPPLPQELEPPPAIPPDPE